MHSSLPSSLTGLSTSELTSLFGDVRERERFCVVDFIQLLIEMERRKAHAELGYESLFAYCVEERHLSESYSFRRITAARLVARFPAITAFLADGRVHLTNLVLLKDVLTAENHLELLERATHRTQRWVKQLLAELHPAPDVGDSFRRLPAVAARSMVVESPRVLEVSGASSIGGSTSANGGRASVPVSFSAAVVPSPGSRRSQLEPLSPGRYLMKVTVGDEFKAKFEKAQAALSHVIPDGDFVCVLDECLTLALGIFARQNRIAPVVRAECSRIEVELAAAGRIDATEIVNRVAPGVASPPVSAGPLVAKPHRSVKALTFAANVEVSWAERSSSTASVGAASAQLAPSGAGLDACSAEPAPSAMDVDASPVQPSSRIDVSDGSSSRQASLDLPPPSLDSRALDGEFLEQGDSDYVPAAVKREVRIRDEDCCAFVSSMGKRCRSTHQLQFHHRVPRAHGGPSTCSNVSLHCRVHNHFRAIVDFGAEHMAKFARGS